MIFCRQLFRSTQSTILTNRANRNFTNEDSICILILSSNQCMEHLLTHYTGVLYMEAIGK